MNSKAKGSRIERKARDVLLAEGYAVTRAAGSLGNWDLVAVPLGEQEFTRLIQVKSNRPPRPAERKRLELEAKAVGPWVLCEVWIWKDYGKDFDRSLV